MERGNSGKAGFSIIAKAKENNYHLIYMMCLAGFSEERISSALGISTSALTHHKHKDPEFFAAMQRGREGANMMVAEALFLNTQDRWIDDEQIHVYKGEVIRVPIKRFIQGDKWAQRVWLASKEREQWAESSTLNINKVQTNVNLDFTGMSFEELKTLEKIGYKQLPENTSDNTQY